jgi:hypothetical protein
VSCRIDYLDRVLLVGHNPQTVFVTTAEHIKQIRRKPDGHYDKEDLIRLVEDGKAVLYSEEMVRDVVHALPYLVYGCPSIST